MCCYEPRLAILVSGVAGMLGMFTLLATERPTQEARDAKPCVRCYEPRLVSRSHACRAVTAYKKVEAMRIAMDRLVPVISAKKEGSIRSNNRMLL